MTKMIKDVWEIVGDSVVAFFDDNALSHGAAMAFYAATSLAPILLIVVAIAGLAFGHEAAQLALSAQVSGMMGSQSADLLQATYKRIQQVIGDLGNYHWLRHPAGNCLRSIR